MKLVILIFFQFIFSSKLFSQTVSVQWQKVFGGSATDFAESIQQTKDSGYIVAGYSYSNDGDVKRNSGGGDFWIIKLNNKGLIEWEKTFGGTSSERASSIKQSRDGGYIIAGYSSSTNGDVSGNHGMQDFWIVKLNSVGNLIWQKSIGGSGWDYAESIQQTFDNGYIVAGWSNSNDGDVKGNHGNSDKNDFLVFKLDSVGIIEWQRSLGGSNSDNAYSVLQTFDSCFIVAGSTMSNDGDVSPGHGGQDYWIVKLNPIGEIKWQKTLGGNGADEARSIKQTLDKGYIIAGYSTSTLGDIKNHHGAISTSDYWVVKIDSLGIIQWEKSLGGTSEDIGKSVQQTNDGGYIVSGYSYSFDEDIKDTCGGMDYWIVKLDNIGQIEWQKSLGGTRDDGGSFENGLEIQQTFDGGYVVAGLSNSIDGNASGNHGNGDYLVVKLKNISSGIANLDDTGLSIYPNPTYEFINIEISNIFLNSDYRFTDESGRVIKSGILSSKSNSIDFCEFHSGIYFLEIVGLTKLTARIIKK
jgi:hypothetical protein